MNTLWNERYADSRYAYGTAPNVFFRQFIEDKKAGKILLPAEGEGRNAVFAASLGWDVHAFDYSEEGRKKALSLARSMNVAIEYEVSDYMDYSCSHDYDLIALIYTHFEPLSRGDLIRKLVSCLSPGGYILMEVFSKKQLGMPSGGPKTEELLYSVEELRLHFTELKVQLLKEMQIVLDEGPYHQGPAEVVRVIARK